jgi:hypothetical protein
MNGTISTSDGRLMHRIRLQKCDAAGAHGVAAHIETRLGVKVNVKWEGDDYGWALDWLDASTDFTRLDFLRPHILPPERCEFGAS